MKTCSGTLISSFISSKSHLSSLIEGTSCREMQCAHVVSCWKVNGCMADPLLFFVVYHGALRYA